MSRDMLRAVLRFQARDLVRFVQIITVCALIMVAWTVGSRSVAPLISGGTMLSSAACSSWQRMAGASINAH